jgi:D-tyrosyl-tRNA(Tyr) deacylase
MLSVIQLVTHAAVSVNDVIIGSIQKGIMALVGIEKTDTEKEAEKLFNKIINYRIFPDEHGKMNLSLKDIQGGLLLVPQFTLVAETTKGTRPGFSTGMPPQEGKQLFEYLVEHAQKQHDIAIASGFFGAYMRISLCNDGPVTFMLEV